MLTTHGRTFIFFTSSFDYSINVSNKDEDDGEHEKDEEIDNEELTHYENVDDEEEE